eukprot:Nitzschia sp. Nitz4//scaffold94_size78252//46135//47792//NITZ4_005470-RA/size78252-augustus-gene-0.65-mRNA-1//1//CDS//3329560386//4027//frame0
MPGATASVIIAATQAVAKVFVVGLIGYMSVLYPKNAPFLPRHTIGPLARFAFHTFTVPLVYGTIAVAVSIETIGDYWFVLVGAIGVITTSYIVATILRYFIPIANERDFQALRISASFPNIVALPILVFPSLCEFKVVYEGFVPHDPEDLEASDGALLYDQCVAQATTMIFIYFFGFSICFWSFGVNSLFNAAKIGVEPEQMTIEAGSSDPQAKDCLPPNASQAQDNDATELPDADSEACGDAQEKGSSGSNQPRDGESVRSRSTASTSCMAGFCASVGTAVKQTCTSPGFVAMILAFITACIPPLQEAMFENGGPLRFFGSAMETLGLASSPISTMVASASLVPLKLNSEEEEEEDESEDMQESPIMSEPTFGPIQNSAPQTRLRRWRGSLRTSSMRIVEAIPRPSSDMMRLHVWFCLSKLVLSPLVVTAIVLSLDCGSSALANVPQLAKFVIIVNSSFPGAQTIIVLLKTREEMADTAAAVAKVYLPSYAVAIFTIAAWTSVGLWATLPDDDGNTFCSR